MPQVPAASVTLRGLTSLQVSWSHWRHHYSATEVWAGPGLSIARPPTHTGFLKLCNKLPQSNRYLFSTFWRPEVGGQGVAGSRFL